MTEDIPPQFRTSALSHRKATRFRWEAGSDARAALARRLDLPGLSRLLIEGEIRPDSGGAGFGTGTGTGAGAGSGTGAGTGVRSGAGSGDFRLEARLRAEVTQACVVTLAPVPATVDEPVLRRYIADWTDPEGEEAEMPEDDSLEPMPAVIDIADVAAEALALALPPWPRAPGAELGEAVFAAPGVAPLRDEDLRPFAALARLQTRQDPKT
jgi:uncharacterized metal-binding protein YceD (DUF177 family)